MKKILFILLFVGSFSFGQDFLLVNGHNHAGCTADANEKHTSSNAAADPHCTEANATTGFLNFTTTTTVNSSDFNVGTYSIQISSNDGGANFGYVSIAATSGDTFDVSYDAKESVGTNAQFLIGGLSVTNTGFANITGSWVTYTFSTQASATGNMQFRWYPASTVGAGNTGDKVLVDNFSVIKTN